MVRFYRQTEPVRTPGAASGEQSSDGPLRAFADLNSVAQRVASNKEPVRLSRGATYRLLGPNPASSYFVEMRKFKVTLACSTVHDRLTGPSIKVLGAGR